MLCRDLQVDPHILRARLIYIDWQNNCRFTREIPRERLSSYRTVAEVVFATDRNVYARKPQSVKGHTRSWVDGM